MCGVRGSRDAEGAERGQEVPLLESQPWGARTAQGLVRVTALGCSMIPVPCLRTAGDGRASPIANKEAYFSLHLKKKQRRKIGKDIYFLKKKYMHTLVH